MNKQLLRDKYTGTLIGCGIGDSLGMPVEMWKQGQIKKYLGRVSTFIDPPVVLDGSGDRVKSDEFGDMPKYFWELKKGQYTDDTILTLAIAEALVKDKGINLNNIAKHQMEAFFYYESKGENRGFGGSTSGAFVKIKNGVSYLESSSQPGTGNGPIMKTSPLGIYMNASGDYDGGLTASLDVAKMTHADENAVEGAVLQTHLIYRLLSNEIKDGSDLINNSLKFIEAKAKGSILENKLEWIARNSDVSVDDALIELGNSCLASESYPFTLFMFQKYWDNSFEGLLDTINTGGDSDTTGAIYGALLGSRDGINAFPIDLVNNLENKERIFKIGYKLAELIK